jgi:PBSX family phage portal protein
MTTTTEIKMAFGDTDSALGIHQINYDHYQFDNVLLDQVHGFYTTPFDMQGLSRLLRVNGHHGRLPKWKAGLMLRYMQPNNLISYGTLNNAAIDLSALGNCYFEIIRNGMGEVLGLKHHPAINMRRMPNNRYCFLQRDPLNPWNFDIKVFPKGKIIHLFEYSPETQIYGVPYWIGALQSIIMGEESRISVRKMFKNGSHRTNVLAVSGLAKEQNIELESKLDEKKGIGNLGTIFLSFPANSSKKLDELVKVIEVCDLSKIDFVKLMNQSASDILEAWGIPPELAGMLPEMAAGSGDLFKKMVMYYEFEVIPFQQLFSSILNLVLPNNAQLAFDNDKINAFNTNTSNNNNK